MILFYSIAHPPSFKPIKALHLLHLLILTTCALFDLAKEVRVHLSISSI